MRKERDEQSKNIALWGCLTPEDVYQPIAVINECWTEAGNMTDRHAFVEGAQCKNITYRESQNRKQQALDLKSELMERTLTGDVMHSVGSISLH